MVGAIHSANLGACGRQGIGSPGAHFVGRHVAGKWNKCEAQSSSAREGVRRYAHDPATVDKPRKPDMIIRAEKVLQKTFYCTAFGNVEEWSPIWRRAERLVKFGRDFGEYLNQWAEFQWKKNGRLPEEEITFPAHARARRTDSNTPTPSGDSTHTADRASNKENP